MHVVGDRPHVVEEFRVHRPPLVGVPHGLADERGTLGGHGVLERELLAVKADETEAFVPDATLIGGFRRAGKPPLVDSAALRAIGVQVAGMKLETAAGVQEATGNPGRRESQQSPVHRQGLLHYVRHCRALNHVRRNHRYPPRSGVGELTF